MEDKDQLLSLLQQAKRLAREYYDLTGRPLGCTGEVAEYEAVRLLGLELAPVRQSGFDAIRERPDGVQRLQIKGRCMHGSKPKGRLGKIDTANQLWDAVVLVVLDDRLEATAIFEADRDAVVTALEKPGSKSRTERGQLGIQQFIRIAHQVWKQPAG